MVLQLEFEQYKVFSELEQISNTNPDQPQPLISSLMLMCLKGCGVTLRDLVEANEEHLIKDLRPPDQSFKTSEELVEKSVMNLKDKSTGNLSAAYDILQKTKSLTVIQRSPSKLLKDFQSRNKKMQDSVIKIQDVNEDFQNAHDTTGTSRLLKLSQYPSLQQLDIQIDKFLLQNQSRKETSIKTIGLRSPSQSELEGYKVGESRRSVNPKETVELKPRFQQIRQKKYQDQINEKIDLIKQQYEERGEDAPYDFEIKVELGNESHDDSILSEGGVPDEDIQHMLQQNVGQEIKKRREKRRVFREASRMDAQAIQLVLEELSRIKPESWLDGASEGIKSELAELKNLYSKLLEPSDCKAQHQERNPQQVKLAGIQNSITQLLSQMRGEVSQVQDSKVVAQEKEFHSSKLFHQSQMTDQSMVRQKKLEYLARLKAFNKHRTTKPGFGQSVRGENFFTAKLARYDKSDRDLTKLSDSMKELVGQTSFNLASKDEIMQYASKVTLQQKDKSHEIKKIVQNLALLKPATLTQPSPKQERSKATLAAAPTDETGNHKMQNHNRLLAFDRNQQIINNELSLVQQELWKREQAVDGIGNSLQVKAVHMRQKSCLDGKDSNLLTPVGTASSKEPSCTLTHYSPLITQSDAIIVSVEGLRHKQKSLVSQSAGQSQNVDLSQDGVLPLNNDLHLWHTSFQELDQPAEQVTRRKQPKIVKEVVKNVNFQFSYTVKSPPKVNILPAKTYKQSKTQQTANKQSDSKPFLSDQKCQKQTLGLYESTGQIAKQSSPPQIEVQPLRVDKTQQHTEKTPDLAELQISVLPDTEACTLQVAALSPTFKIKQQPTPSRSYSNENDLEVNTRKNTGQRFELPLPSIQEFQPATRLVINQIKSVKKVDLAENINWSSQSKQALAQNMIPNRTHATPSHALKTNRFFSPAKANKTPRRDSNQIYLMAREEVQQSDNGMRHVSVGGKVRSSVMRMPQIIKTPSTKHFTPFNPPGSPKFKSSATSMQDTPNVTFQRLNSYQKNEQSDTSDFIAMQQEEVDSAQRVTESEMKRQILNIITYDSNQTSQDEIDETPEATPVTGPTQMQQLEDRASMLVRQIKLPIVYQQQSYKKVKRQKPESVITDYQFMQLSNEPLQRVLGLDHIKRKVKPEGKQTKPVIEPETRQIIYSER